MNRTKIRYSLQKTWVFSTFFYLRLLKNVNKTPKFLQLYSTVDQNKEINLLISTVGTIVETSVKKKLNKSFIHKLDECRR